MSAQQEKNARATVLLEYTESKQKLALLRAQVDMLATEFEELAKILKDNPENVPLEVYELILDYKTFCERVSDLKLALKETRRLEETVRKLGLSHLT
jgi:hypothetical protein